MVNSAKASDLSLIEPVLKKYKNTAGSLITVLQEIQDIYGYLPEDAICHAAIELGVAPALRQPYSAWRHSMHSFALSPSADILLCSVRAPRAMSTARR